MATNQLAVGIVQWPSRAAADMRGWLTVLAATAVLLAAPADALAAKLAVGFEGSETVDVRVSCPGGGASIPGEGPPYSDEFELRTTTLRRSQPVGSPHPRPLDSVVLAGDYRGTERHEMINRSFYGEHIVEHDSFSGSRQWFGLGVRGGSLVVDPGHELAGEVLGTVPAGLARGRKGTYSVSFEASRAEPDNEDCEPSRTVRIQGTIDLEVVADEGELRADAGDARSVARGSTVSLDGGGSTPRARIRSYRWTFRPLAECPDGLILRPTRLTTARVRIALLCGVRATLTVTDARGRHDSDSVEIPVVRRGGDFARTPFSHRDAGVDSGDPRVPLDVPWRDREGVAAMNVPDCAVNPLTWTTYEFILCPLQEREDRRREKSGGFRLARVDDKGPFRDFWYVGSTSIAVKRVALYNPYFLPAGRPIPDRGTLLADVNRANGANYDAYLGALRMHEGMGGPGARLTGHSGRLALWMELRERRWDPRRVIEPIFGIDRRRTATRVDGALDEVEDVLGKATKDPLPVIFSDKIYFPVRGDPSTWMTDTEIVGG